MLHAGNLRPVRRDKPVSKPLLALALIYKKMSAVRLGKHYFAACAYLCAFFHSFVRFEFHMDWIISVRTSS